MNPLDRDWIQRMVYGDDYYLLSEAEKNARLLERCWQSSRDPKAATYLPKETK